PSKFSKDQLRTLEMLHEGFSRSLSLYLSSRLRTVVHCSIAGADQLPYGEYIQSVPIPSFIVVYTMESLNGTALLEISNNIIFSMVDRLLGGPGRGIKKNRELTDIEMSVIEDIIDRILELLGEAWSSIINTSPVRSGIETNPQFIQQIVPLSSVVALISFSIQIGDSASGFINLCIPSEMLEAILPKLSARQWFSRKGSRQEEIIQRLKRKLENIEVPIVVELGEAEITFEELLNLKVGDIIKLNTLVMDPLLVKVGDQPKYLGRPGRVGKNIGVKILGNVSRGE
ncbi:MAG: flagellar motor switch protein FliM, partial [bacterium]|nr:flagellar motor switch protein FliM [bacterium]